MVVLEDHIDGNHKQLKASALTKRCGKVRSFDDVAVVQTGLLLGLEFVE